MSDRTSLKADALVYMTNNGILEKLRPLAVVHSMECLREPLLNKPLIVDFEVDLILLIDSSIPLYEKLVDYPTAARSIFEEALLGSLRSYFEINNCRLCPFIQLLLRCKSFSSLSGRLEDVNSVFAKSTGCLSGSNRYILTSITISRSDKCKVATICVLYRCPDATCCGFKGRYITMDELEDNGRDDNCQFCGKKCLEDLSGRGQVKKVLAKFFPAEAFGQEKLRKPYRSITCSIIVNSDSVDPMVKELELGDMYNICGYHDGSIFQMWGLQRTHFFYAPPPSSSFPLPPSIRILRLSLGESANPWNFVRKLSLEFGSRIYRRKAAPSLKLGLLLSLASLGSERCAPVLCVGQNIDILEEDVISYAAKCADRNVRIKFPIGITTETNGENTWLHSRSLLWAKRGICNVGNWKILKTAQRNQLLEVLDNGYIATGGKRSKNTSEEDAETVDETLPLRTALWTCYSCDKNCGQEKPDLLDTLIKMFGIPFYSNASEHTQETIHECIELMVNATKINGTPGNTVSREEMTEFLRMVNGIDVKLTQEATGLMKTYFVACRKARGNVFPPQSITFMTTLADAHTRLCLRSEVTYDDVVAVIYLYEESMCFLYGFSVSEPPPFTLQADSDVSEGMEAFKRWLKSYLGSLV